MGIVRVGVFQVGDVRGENCLGWEWLMVGIVRMEIVRVGIVRGGNGLW